MGIKIKYDPVGSLFLGSFQTGIDQNRERRRREMIALQQHNADLLQRSQQNQLNRGARAGRNMINLGPAAGVAPVAALPAPGGNSIDAGRATRRAAHEAEMEARRNAFVAGRQSRAALAGNTVGGAPPAPVADAAQPAMPSGVPTVTMDFDGNRYVDPRELDDYWKGVLATVEEGLSDDEVVALDPKTAQQYYNEAAGIKTIQRGQAGLDKNDPDTWVVVQRMLADMQRMKDVAQRKIQGMEDKEAEVVAQQQDQEAQAAAQQQELQAQATVQQAEVADEQNKATESRAQAAEDYTARQQNRQKQKDIRQDLEDTHRKQQLDAIKSDAKLTPEQKAKKTKEINDASVKMLNDQEAVERAHIQKRLDGLNLRVAMGGKLSPAEEAMRESFIREIEMDSPPAQDETGAPEPDANQKLVDDTIFDEQIRQRYGITGPIGPAVRAYHARQLARERDLARSEAERNDKYAQHPVGAKSGLPVRSPSGGRYKKGTEFAKDKKGRVLYRSGGIPMVTKGYNEVDKPPPLYIGTGRGPKTPSPAETGEIAHPIPVTKSIAAEFDPEFGMMSGGEYPLDAPTPVARGAAPKASNAIDRKAAELADKWLPHPKTPEEAKQLGSGAWFVDPKGKIRQVP